MKTRDILIALYIYCEGNWDDMFYHINHRSQLDYEKILEGVDKSKYITLVDEDYPPHLKYRFQPDFVICK